MTSVLKLKQKDIAVTTKAHDPKKFFVDRKGLYVWSSFVDNIVAKAKTKEVADLALTSYNLEESALDEKIEATFTKGHLFSETDVCAVIASLIEQQPNGEEGVLLTNGYANIFYTKSHVVRVRWFGSDWDVYGWCRFGEWLAGCRVFSPATSETCDLDSDACPSALAALEERVATLEAWKERVTS
jgi:hypothetical protein